MRLPTNMRFSTDLGPRVSDYHTFSKLPVLHRYFFCTKQEVVWEEMCLPEDRWRS